MIRANLWQNIKRLYSSGTVERRLMPPSQLNAVYGVKLDYGWFFVPKKLYAADYTIPLLRDYIGNKYPDIDKNPRSFSEIQDTVDEWVASSKPRRPKPTKLSAVAREEAQKVKLLEKQMGKEHIKETKAKQKVQKKSMTLDKKKNRALENKELCLYVLKHKKMPPDYNYNEITMTHAWNHFAAKNYVSADAATYKSDAKKALALKWNKMTPQERETERQELIRLMKEGTFYSQGKILPIREKYAKLKYKIFKAVEKLEAKESANSLKL